MRLSVLVCALAAAIGLASPADAATFNVNPTQIFLTGKNGSALLSLKNNSDQPLRFQLTAFTWNQGARGEMELEPTTDVVFFPALLSLKPGEERKVRVGGVAAGGPREKTYRIFVEELPSVEATAPGAAVKVLTKMGIPIFVRPASERTVATLDGVTAAAGHVRFTVANGGTVHVVPQDIKVRTKDAAGATLLDQAVPGWYVLAGGRREFDVELPAAACGSIASISVEAQIDGKAVTRTIAAPGGACAE